MKTFRTCAAAQAQKPALKTWLDWRAARAEEAAAEAEEREVAGGGGGTAAARRRAREEEEGEGEVAEELFFVVVVVCGVVHGGIRNDKERDHREATGRRGRELNR